MSKLQAHKEAIINAPVINVWSIITDISLLDKINPGVITAKGRMDKQGETRTCEMQNGGKKGTMTERLAELVHEKKTVSRQNERNNLCHSSKCRREKNVWRLVFYGKR